MGIWADKPIPLLTTNYNRASNSSETASSTAKRPIFAAKTPILNKTQGGGSGGMRLGWVGRGGGLGSVGSVGSGGFCAVGRD
jgi:hypothetical protein